MFNILGISGSPRKDGNTEILVNHALEPFVVEGHRVHRFFLSEKKVSPCRACEMCSQEGICAIKDDFHSLLEKLDICSAVIIGSPVYMRNITAQLKAVFDRFHCIFKRRPFKNKICLGGAIAVGGSVNSQGIVLTIVYNFLLSLGICSVLGVANGVSVVARELGEVKDQPTNLQDVHVLGSNILTFLKKIPQG